MKKNNPMVFFYCLKGKNKIWTKYDRLLLFHFKSNHLKSFRYQQTKYVSPPSLIILSSVYLTITPFSPYFQCAKIWFELSKKESHKWISQKKNNRNLLMTELILNVIWYLKKNNHRLHRNIAVKKWDTDFLSTSFRKTGA